MFNRANEYKMAGRACPYMACHARHTVTGRKRGETDHNLHPPFVTLADNLKIGKRVRKSVQGAGPVEAYFSDLSFFSR